MPAPLSSVKLGRDCNQQILAELERPKSPMPTPTRPYARPAALQSPARSRGLRSGSRPMHASHRRRYDVAYAHTPAGADGVFRLKLTD